MTSAELLTVLIFSSLLGLCAGGLLLGTWWATRQAKPGCPAFLLAWAGFCLLGGLAGVLFALRGWAPKPVWVIGANMALLLAMSLFWWGARALRGVAAPAWMVLPAPLLWLGACAVPAFYDTDVMRVATGAILYGGFEAAAAVELLRRRQSGALRGTAPILGALAGLGSTTHLARIALVLLGLADLSFSLIALSSAALFIAVCVTGTALVGEVAAARDAAVLQAGRAEVERLHTGLPAVIFLRRVAADGTSRLLYRGGDLETVLGWPAEVMAGHTTLESFMEPDQPPLTAVMLDLLCRGTLVYEWRIRQPDGSWRWLRTQARRLSMAPEGGGEVVGYVVNIDAERAAQAHAVAAARLASLGEMAAGLAHEMRQPLATITLALGNAQRALARGDAAAAAPRLDRAIAQTLRAGTLIEHLRRFARGAEAHEPVAPFALDLAVGGALALVGDTLRDAGITVDVALDTPPPVVVGHLVPLEQVLVNLLSNALHALAERPDGTPRRVRISATAEDGPHAGTVRLTVADTAGGIPAAVMARLFEPFVTTKGPEGGTGLGLSICRGMMQGMGGSIAAANDEEGARFTLRLPAAPRPPDRTAALAETGAAG